MYRPTLYIIRVHTVGTCYLLSAYNYNVETHTLRLNSKAHVNDADETAF
jgi:hypothetical protein